MNMCIKKREKKEVHSEHTQSVIHDIVMHVHYRSKVLERLVIQGFFFIFKTFFLHCRIIVKTPMQRSIALLLGQIALTQPGGVFWVIVLLKNK